MSARLLAAFCLSNLVVCPGWGAFQEQPESELVVYLSGGVQPQRPLLYMKAELGRLMSTAGYHIEWTDARDREKSSTYSQLTVVELRGTCEMTTLPAAKVGVLASTAVSGGKIIPFSSVDCASLTRMLSAPLVAEPPARRDFLYGRAMARLLAHELYHVLLNTEGHSREGIAQAGFSTSDLLTEHFEFEAGTLAKLRPVPTTRGTGSAGDEGVGR
jgi:hypothetical protein